MCKKKKRLIGMLCQELVRVMMQPWCWIAVFGCTVLKFVCVFGTSDTYNLVFEQGIRSSALLNLSYVNAWDSFLSYVPFCLCAFPFVGNVIQDEKCNRMTFLLLRTGCWNYAVVQVMVTFLGAFFCKMFGDILFLLVGHFGVGLSLFGSGINAFTASNLMEGQHMFGFMVATELQTCMQVVFYSLLAMMVSFVVKDMQFVTVLPMVFLYFTMYFFTSEVLPIPKWMDPKGIYMHNWGMFAGDDIAQCLYASFFSVLTAVITSVFLYFMLKRQVRE